MNDLKQTFRNLGLDGWIFGLTSLAAIIFGILSFLGALPFDEKQTSSILIGAVGLLMAAVVAQTARRHAEIMELKSALGISESQFISGSQEFGQHLITSAMKTKRFILDTRLNWAIVPARAPSYFSGPQADYRRLLFERVNKDEISFKRVEVIFNERGLETAIHRLLLHDDHNYFIRYYEPPPKPIPIIHIMSFDDEAFYLGGFHTKESPGEEEVLYIREPKLAKILKDYWGVLWDGATPLNEGKVIDWEELKRVALKIGMLESDFNSMIERVKDEVQREKRQIRKR